MLKKQWRHVSCYSSKTDKKDKNLRKKLVTAITELYNNNNQSSGVVLTSLGFQFWESGPFKFTLTGNMTELVLNQGANTDGILNERKRGKMASSDESEPVLDHKPSHSLSTHPKPPLLDEPWNFKYQVRPNNNYNFNKSVYKWFIII